MIYNKTRKKLGDYFMPKNLKYKNKLQYNNTYNRENYRPFSVRFNNESESNIIHWLEKQPSIKRYLSDLILADIKKNKGVKKATATTKKKTLAKKKK